MSDPDAGLMLAFKAGDDDAFARLVEKHTDALLNYFFFQSGDRHLAEDCVQELWAKIFRSRSEYVPRAAFTTFLFRAARNLWIDVYRAAARRPRTTTLSSAPGQEPEGRPLSERVPSEASQAADADAEDRELVRLLAEALARLPPEMREVYVLAEVEGLSYAEVATVLGVPVGTVKSRMFTAVRRLQRILKARLPSP